VPLIKVAQTFTEMPESMLLYSYKQRETTHMRKIESQMVAAIKSNKDFKVANTEVISCTHTSDVYLHGNLIARIGETWIELFDGGWQTSTTKSRLNAILSEFGMSGECVYPKEL
jgi:hypothetical protein